MLRLWPDQICAFVSPYRLALVRRKGLAGKVIAHRTDSFDTPKTAEQTVNELETRLQGEPWQGASSLTVVVSNHWVRYAVVPWNEKLQRLQDVSTLARLILEENYAERAEQLELKISSQGYGKPSLAAGLDPMLFGQLHQAAQQARLKLESAQPLLMSAYNPYHARFRQGQQAFVCVEPGKLLLAQVIDGAWQSILARGLPKQPESSVADILIQCWAQLEQLPAQAHLLAPDYPELQLRVAGGVTVELLQDASASPLASHNAPYRFAQA